MNACKSCGSIPAEDLSTPSTCFPELIKINAYLSPDQESAIRAALLDMTHHLSQLDCEITRAWTVLSNLRMKRRLLGDACYQHAALFVDCHPRTSLQYLPHLFPISRESDFLRHAILLTSVRRHWRIVATPML